MSNKRSLVNQTIDQLVLWLNQENYSIGEKLPVEAELAKMLKVGRSTLREAVKILAFSNILEVKQGSGTYLKNKSASEIFSIPEVLTARAMIEIQTAEIIIQQGYEVPEMLALKELLFQRNQLLAQGKFTEFIHVDEAFHLQFIQLAKNSLLLRWYQELLPVLRIYQSNEVIKTSNYQDNTQLHNQLYEALVAKDFPKALEAIKKNSNQS